MTTPSRLTARLCAYPRERTSCWATTAERAWTHTWAGSCPPTTWWARAWRCPGRWARSSADTLLAAGEVGAEDGRVAGCGQRREIRCLLQCRAVERQRSVNRYGSRSPVQVSGVQGARRRGAAGALTQAQDIGENGRALVLERAGCRAWQQHRHAGFVRRPDAGVARAIVDQHLAGLGMLTQPGHRGAVVRQVDVLVNDHRLQRLEDADGTALGDEQHDRGADRGQSTERVRMRGEPCPQAQHPRR